MVAQMIAQAKDAFEKVKTLIMAQDSTGYDPIMGSAL